MRRRRFNRSRLVSPRSTTFGPDLHRLDRSSVPAPPGWHGGWCCLLSPSSARGRSTPRLSRCSATRRPRSSPQFISEAGRSATVASPWVVLPADDGHRHVLVVSIGQVTDRLRPKIEISLRDRFPIESPSSEPHTEGVVEAGAGFLHCSSSMSPTCRRSISSPTRGTSRQTRNACALPWEPTLEISATRGRRRHAQETRNVVRIPGRW